MPVGRRGGAERANDEQLPEGGLDQIGAAHDFGDAEFDVVHGAGELVAGQAVLAPDEEVAEVASGYGASRAGGAVVEGDGLAVGHAKAPVAGEAGGVERGRRGVGGRAKFGRVNRFVVERALVRRGDGGGFDFAARAVAGKDQSGGVQSGEGGAVGGQALALGDDRFLPDEPEPAKVLDEGGGEFRSAAGVVEIVVAQQQPTAGFGGASGRGQKSARVSQVQVTGGRGGEAADVGGGGHGAHWNAERASSPAAFVGVGGRLVSGRRRVCVLEKIGVLFRRSAGHCRGFSRLCASTNTTPWATTTLS